MKPSLSNLLVVFLPTVLAIGIATAGGPFVAAQTAANSAKPGRASIDGIVIKDPGSEPVKKAVIELIAENQSQGGDYTALSGADGAFHMDGILPGKYHLFAERAGMLEVDKHRARPEGRVLTLAAGQEVKDVSIRLQAAAVVHGRVTDEDGDAMPSAQVSVLRQTFISGHSRWEQAGAERTNDLGEYRVAGLPAGNYYVSVSPPPDFRSLIEASGKVDASATAGKTGTTYPMSYQTTFYPGTLDRSQAAPIELHAGDEFPVNFSLTQSPSLSIRGTVVNVPRGAEASVMLRSRDFNVVFNGAEIHQDGSFVIRDVSPGNYTILASVEGPATGMSARQTLQVAGSDVEGLRLAPQPGSTIRGRLRLESKALNGRFDPSQVFLVLRPADGGDDVVNVAMSATGFSDSTHVAGDGSFEWANVPAGTYYVQFEGDYGVNGDWYLKSALAAGRNVKESGISVSGGAVALDLVASSNGGAVEGMVADAKGDPVANAVIVAVPEPRLRSRIDCYRKTVSDQSGRFVLHGIEPGDYTLLAWDSVDGEAYYNPEFVKNYEAQGSALKVSEGDRKTLRLSAIMAEEQQ